MANESIEPAVPVTAPVTSTTTSGYAPAYACGTHLKPDEVVDLTMKEHNKQVAIEELVISEYLDMITGMTEATIATARKVASKEYKLVKNKIEEGYEYLVVTPNSVVRYINKEDCKSEQGNLDLITVVRSAKSKRERLNNFICLVMSLIMLIIISFTLGYYHGIYNHLPWLMTVINK